ncbi:MAG: hypothetical protein WD397_16645 [Wenzhouxiangellaceae bacterium]
MNVNRPGALDLVGIAALSGSVLAFEVILLRLFEFSHWHHFAGLSIALALLGLGTAGTVLALAGDRAVAGGSRWFVTGMLIAAAGFLFVLWLNSQIALRPVFAAWDAVEMARVLAVDFAAFVPFFGAGLALGQVFPRWPAFPARLYSANLFGSGIGSVAASVLMVFLAPESALALVAVVLLVAAVLICARRGMPGRAIVAIVIVLPAGLFVYSPPEPKVSDFKALAELADLPGSETISESPGLYGRLSVVRAPSLRIAPGLSLSWTGAIPVRDAAVIGSDTVIPLSTDYAVVPDHAEASLVALPLALRPTGRVLVVGSSDWATPAMAAGRALTWLEPDRRLTDLARERGARFEAASDSAYRFLRTSNRKFSLISLDGVFAAGDAASEDYLLTSAGLADALKRLSAGGLLAVAVPIEYPPRQGPRLLASVAAALERLGVEQPGTHVAALRGMQSMLVLAGPQPMKPFEIQAVAAFGDAWQFDRVWLPGMSAGQANRHHVLDQPVFHQAAAAVLSGEPMPQTARWFETRPATLARPYFWRAMQWHKLPQMFGQLGKRAASLLDWTLVMSLLAMVLVTLLAAVLIVAPLGKLPRLVPPLGRVSVAGYFVGLGLGFMLLEMAVFQRVIMFLDRPVLAASVVFAVFLVGAGLGSAMAPKHNAVARIFGALAAGGAITVAALWLAADWLLALPLAPRIAALALLMLPMTWAMGRPFPWALGRLSAQSNWLPWGWGINAFASVAAASAAPLISVQFGQPATLLAGAVCYLAVWRVARGWVILRPGPAAAPLAG